MDSWYYEDSLGAMDFMPEQNSFLDIWKYKVSTILIENFLSTAR
jgi:hypothetical protein